MLVVVALSTTADDTIYLTSLFIEGSKIWIVILGELIGFAILVSVSLLISHSLPHLHLLGLIPISIGLYKLRGQDKAGKGQSRKSSSLISVILLNLSSGGNNMAIFIPLFSKEDPWPFILTCYLFILLWLCLSKVIANQSFLNHLYKITPYLYIGIGLKIMLF